MRSVCTRSWNAPPLPGISARSVPFLSVIAVPAGSARNASKAGQGERRKSAARSTGAPVYRRPRIAREREKLSRV